MLICLGFYDLVFSKHKQWMYNANTFKNAESHLLEEHFLDQGGDI
jgi:hypothetical protein